MSVSADVLCREIVDRLLQIPNLTKEDLNLAKIEVCRKHGFGRLPSNSEILRCLSPVEREKFLSVVRRKIVRGISGITIVAVMTKPYACPKESPCAYCPGGPSFGVPQSYTGHEPASMRGIQNQFDPYQQVSGRIRQLEEIGHEVDKVEIVVMGGTFPATLVDYQEWFIQRCLDAITENKSETLEEAKRNAETSRIRNVGITVETRPDWAREKDVDHMLSMGVTRVELGVQNLYDDIYERVDRGHRVQDVVESFRVTKDAGLKVVAHMMPGLPGSNIQRDLEAFSRLFSDPRLNPDMIKIYPCLVLEGTRVYEWWRKGEYAPYTTEEAVDLLVKMKRVIPPWIRVMRVQRDIPARLIVAGVKSSNLRQLVAEKLKENGERCRCIRCREVGHRMLRDGVKPSPEEIEISKQEYEASNGLEIFIPAEDPRNDVLVGYLRLRIPSEKAFRPEIARQKASIVRELHVYGPMVPVGKRFLEAWQHKGYGSILLSEAEKISHEDYDLEKIAVLSALGTKQYYMRFGYARDGPYMSKLLA